MIPNLVCNYKIQIKKVNKRSARLLVDAIFILSWWSHYKFVYYMQADQSGTIVEIIAEDAKSVSVDTVSICRTLMTSKTNYLVIRDLIYFVLLQPLLVIEP